MMMLIKITRLNASEFIDLSMAVMR